ncbi:MAG: DUF4129 domain-containing protein [Chloroflexi bacterium SZAS-1]|nr:DUF4129 domain-containing protein [Chloroflexi bacterium SZAS-1]
MPALNRQGLLFSALMLAALVAALCGPVQRFIPDWQPLYLIGASFLVALEAGAVHYTFRREALWGDEIARYLVPEVFVMIVLMRVATALAQGHTQLFALARDWLYDPLQVFDTSFVVAIILGLMIGLVAHLTMRDLFLLEPRPTDAHLSTAEDMRHAALMATYDRRAALRRVGSRFIQGGVLLLLALGLESVNIQQISAPGLPISRLSSIAALVYFICGFLLYSQAWLAFLRARWYIDGATIAAEVPRRWTIVSGLIIGGIVGGASFLPRAYGMGLLATLQQSLGLLGYLIAVIGYGLTTLVSVLAVLPLLLLSWLTGRGSQQPLPELPQIVPPPDAPPPGTYEPRLWAAMLFWLCMALLAGYAILIVVQRNPGLMQVLTRRGPLGWLLRQLAWLWRDTRVWAGQAAQRARALLQRPPQATVTRIPGLRLRRLAPRELVRYFYRSTLRRAAAGGVPRRTSQTPYEYSARLAQHLPEAQADLTDLTEAFVVAEYSPHPVDTAAAQRARQPWERIRRRLRNLAHSATPGSDIQE